MLRHQREIRRMQGNEIEQFSSVPATCPFKPDDLAAIESVLQGRQSIPQAGVVAVRQALQAYENLIKSIPAGRITPRAKLDFCFKHFAPQRRRCTEL